MGLRDANASKKMEKCKNLLLMFAKGQTQCHIIKQIAKNTHFPHDKNSQDAWIGRKTLRMQDGLYLLTGWPFFCSGWQWQSWTRLVSASKIQLKGQTEVLHCCTLVYNPPNRIAVPNRQKHRQKDRQTKVCVIPSHIIQSLFMDSFWCLDPGQVALP